MSRSSLDARRARVTKIGTALPEADAQQTGPLRQHTTFRVRGRVFAYYVVDEHGDGRIALLCKSEPHVREALLASNPQRYFVPKYIGPRGWLGYDFDAGKIDWAQVAELMRNSYRLIAPKPLFKEIYSLRSSS